MMDVNLADIRIPAILQRRCVIYFYDWFLSNQCWFSQLTVGLSWKYISQFYVKKSSWVVKYSAFRPGTRSDVMLITLCYVEATNIQF